MPDALRNALGNGLPARTRPPVEITATETPSLKSLLTIVVGVVAVAGLYFARDVLIPITLALLLSFLLAPLVSLLRRMRLGRVVSSLIAVLLALALLLALGGLIGIQMAELANQLPRYQYTIQRKVDAVRGATLDRLSANLGDLGRQLKDSGAALAPVAPAAPAALVKGAAAPAMADSKPLPVEVYQPAPSPMEVTERILASVLGPLATTGVVFIVAIFILLQREDLRDRMIRLFGSRDLHRTTNAMNDAARRLSRYFLMQMAINAGFGVVVAGGLFLIGIPSALLWGVMAALLRFVPYIGAPLAALLPLTLAAAVDPGWSMMAWTAGLYVVLELIVAQAVEPMLYSRSTGLSPFSVVIAATFWIWLWGPIGLILSTPLTLCLVVLGRHVARLEFLEVMLGDRPALTSVEGFYQRVLAGDSDEVEEQAEILLKECSLSEYYDEVALKGLQLASYDASRGVLTERQVERMKRAIMAVIDDLGTHEDRDPKVKLDKSDHGDPGPVFATQATVLCIAGRGPLDQAATAILAQLLAKNGVGVRVAQQEDVARDRLAGLDTAGVTMICLVYLGPSGTPSHLRYLIRRLRLRAPGLPIAMAFWPAEDDAPLEVLPDDERARAAVDADYYASSFRDVVVSCLEAAHLESAT